MALAFATAALACDAGTSHLPRTLLLRLADGTSHSTCREAAATLPAAAPGRPAFPPNDCRDTSGPANRRTLQQLRLTAREDPVAAAAWSTWQATDARSLRRAAQMLAGLAAAEAPTALVARAAVLHALSRATGSPIPALQALELLEQARSQAPTDGGRTPKAVSFDRAVVLADLGLCHLAAQAFELALTEERDESWRAEIEQREAALPCRLAVAPATTPDGKIEVALDSEVAAAAAALGTPGERTVHARLARLGAELQAGGEPLVSAIADELADAHRTTDSGYRRAVLDATAGRRAFVDLDFERSRRLLAGSCGALQERGSALAGWCRYWRLANDLYFGELDAARHGLARLRADAASPYLRGRAAWSEGLAALRGGALGAAYDRFETAGGEFSTVGLLRSRAAVEVMRAEVLSTLGALEEAAVLRRGALVVLQGEEPHFVLLNGLIDAADDAHRSGFTRASRAYLAEAALLARAQGNRVAQTEIRLWEGELELAGRRPRAAAGAVDAARQHFLAARTLARGLAGELFPERSVVRANLGLAESGDPAYRGRAELLALADYFARKGPRSGELRALTLLIEEAERAGDEPLARETYRRVRALIEMQRSDLHGVTRDAKFIASQRAFFDRMIAAALVRGDAWRGLALVADASPGAPPGGTSRPELAVELATALSDRALLVYRFLDERLAWWSLHNGRLRHGTLDDGAAVHRLIDELRAARGKPSEAQIERGHRLLLAAPLAGVPDGTPVVLVADQDLAAVPFAALRESAAHVRLIERHPLSMAMSPRNVAEHRAIHAALPFRATVIGDPAFDRRKLPWLPRLPGALDEARQVAALYGSDAELLAGKSATPKAVRASARGASVLHVAAHALAGEAGGATALVLAADDATGSSGLSSGEELAAAGDAADLVVLSACATLDARGSDGLIGLAGPFLAAGSSAVVGTLWPVEDGEVAGWMVELHRLMASGISASRSLQQVQSRAAATGPCCRWAALALVGDLTLPARPAPPPITQGRPAAVN